MYKTISASYFILKIGEDKEGKRTFSVPKRIDKRATKRNRLRRVFKASLDNLLGKSSHRNLLFLVKKESLGIDQKEIEAQLEKILKKEKIIE
jgi:ribonuclease P protein component